VLYLPGDWEHPETHIDYVAKFKGVEQLAIDEYVYDDRVIDRKAWLISQLKDLKKLWLVRSHIDLERCPSPNRLVWVIPEREMRNVSKCPESRAWGCGEQMRCMRF
jgi:hypothetical protein